MPNKRFTILVPIYDEEDNIERLSETLNAYLSIAKVPSQVLFVNDGSKDNSLSLVKNACAKYEDLHFISLAKNKGLSGAI